MKLKIILIILLVYNDDDNKYGWGNQVNETISNGNVCNLKLTDRTVRMIIDYVKWRGNIRYLYIVDEFCKLGCNMNKIKNFYRLFQETGIFLNFRNNVNFTHPIVYNALIVSLIDDDHRFRDNIYAKQINYLSSLNGYIKWMSIVLKHNNKINVDNTMLAGFLAASNMTLNSDIVLAIETENHQLGQVNNELSISDNNTNANNPSLSDNKSGSPVETILPFYNNNLLYNILSEKTNDIHLDDYCKTSNQMRNNTNNNTMINAAITHNAPFCILQIYKIRKNYNDSFVIRPLGYWHTETRTSELKPFQSLEKRVNFQKFPFIFGKKSFTQDAKLVDESLLDDDDDEENMDKISDYLISFLNATEIVLIQPTISLKTPDGLLGAIVDETVDLGLDMVIKVSERYASMAFTFDIMQSVRNIYVKPEESHSARDIFLIPFGKNMLLSVLATCFIFTLAMSVYLKLTYGANLNTPDKETSYFSAFSDAFLWGCALFSSQGSLIQSRKCSGNLIILLSLVFTLIIYNSYSAFLTSVLSVKLTRIRSVDDLLESNYAIAYSRNSQDEIYLRSMNNVSQLNQIYLRGYLHNNISNITEGLLRATKGNYGFFATGHVARKEILKINNYRCRYDLMEIRVPSTINNIAFPISKNSPYKKFINLGLIKMRESGVHNYLIQSISPKLMKCIQKKTFKSARLNDLITSFLLLGLGTIGAILISIIEFIWKHRRATMRLIKYHYNNNHHYHYNNHHHHRFHERIPFYP